jgi:hypothetical protein
MTDSLTIESDVESVPNGQARLRVLNPVAEQDERRFPVSPRLADLAGKTVALAWNRKPGGNIALGRIAEHLRERIPDINLVNFDDDIPFGPETIELIVDRCDAVIGSTADCGACSSWLAHDMIEIEKSGVPVVMITARAFVDDAEMSMHAYGMPDLPTAVFEGHEFTSQPDRVIFDLVDPIIDDLIAKLTSIEVEAPSDSEDEVFGDLADSEDFVGPDTLAAWEVFNNEFLDRGWGDGFPLIAPTPEKVRHMLTGTARQPTDVITLLEPAFGIATVEKLAISAVMAGCAPEHLPVLIACVEALSDRSYWLRNVAVSTSPHAPMIVINGPIAKRIGVNSGRCALGPGKPSRVNTVIGRALRLIMMNVGHSYPGVLDMDTIGAPNKYSMCIAENEDDSPWEPLHVERGFRRDQSVVTMFSVESQMEIYDLKNHTPETILNGYAGTVNSLGSTHTRQWMYPRRHADNAILLSPTHAKAIAVHGWSRNDVRRFIYEKARVPAEMLQIILDDDRIMPSMRWVRDAPPGTMIPVTGAYDWFHVIVIGGPVGKSSFTSGHGQCVSRVIEDR